MKSQAERAEEIGVSRQSLATWIKKGAPFEDDRRLAVWLLNQERITAKVRAWCNKVIKRETPRQNHVAKDDAELKNLEGILDYYMGKLNESVQHGELESIKFWNEHVIKTSESIRRSEAHAAKLGIDNGTVLPRAEVERILRAVFYAGNGCVNGALSTICEHLAGLSDPSDVYHALKPAIVGGRLFSGFDKVANIKGAPALPDWVIECVKLEAQQYLGNSESLWTNKLK